MQYLCPHCKKDIKHSIDFHTIIMCPNCGQEHEYKPIIGNFFSIKPIFQNEIMGRSTSKNRANTVNQSWLESFEASFQESMKLDSELRELKVDLKIAERHEDYERCADLRDKINELQKCLE